MSDERADSRKLLECDLVLKGGVASGVVFPSAVAELAKDYRFRSLGGTSAGAIAATVAAAAEFRRQRVLSRDGTGPNDGRYGFSRIDEMANELGQTERGTRKIVSLFQPSPAVAPLFRIALRVLGTASSTKANATPSDHSLLNILRVFFEVNREFWLYWVLFIIPVMLGVYYKYILHNLSNITTFSIVSIMFCAIIIQLLIIGLRLICIVLKLPKLRYGMCSGRSPRGGSNPEGLSEWMHRLVQEVAGQPGEAPLTFGQLWTLGKSPTSASTTVKREIELVLITSNLTQGLSHRLPFIEKSPQQPLYFRRDDLIEVLPDEIVDWMIRHPNLGENPLRRGSELYHRLPAPADLPIVFGARISLSFPILLQAIPLFTTDHIGDRLVRCWFSDGGITSNFPVHLFDAPLPTWPTFCINLLGLDPNRPAVDPPGVQNRAERLAWNRISMATTNDGGQRARFNIFDARKPTLFGFIVAMIDTARENRDNELALMPGYRDRIVNIELDSGEGGLHLDTPPEVIETLSTRGRMAAKLLKARYSGQDSTDPRSGDRIVLDWNNHRWVRLRSVIAALELTILQLRSGWTHGGGSPSYKDLFNGSAPNEPYGWTDAPSRNCASEAMAAIVRLAEDWDNAWPIFDMGDDARSGHFAPRPKSVLRMGPNGDQDPIAMGFADRAKTSPP